MSNSSATSTSHDHHIVPTPTYILTLLALLLLMALTIGVSYIQIPDIWIFTGTVLNQVAALIIAIIKASLVVFIFMGVRWQTSLTKMWAATGFVWFTLIFMILGDYVTRKWEPLNSWQPNPQSGMSRTAHAGTPFPPSDPSEANLHARD